MLDAGTLKSCYTFEENHRFVQEMAFFSSCFFRNFANINTTTIIYIQISSSGMRFDGFLGNSQSNQKYTSRFFAVVLSFRCNLPRLN